MFVASNVKKTVSQKVINPLLHYLATVFCKFIYNKTQKVSGIPDSLKRSAWVSKGGNITKLVKIICKI